jgi:hypothetical protein
VYEGEYEDDWPEDDRDNEIEEQYHQGIKPTRGYTGK